MTYDLARRLDAKIECRKEASMAKVFCDAYHRWPTRACKSWEAIP